MRVHYDAETETVYIDLGTANAHQVISTTPVDDLVSVDRQAGMVVGIEITGVSVAPQVLEDDQVPLWR